MKRVCILCEAWESGGIESFLCNTLLTMDRSELEIDIVAAQIRDSVFTEALKNAGVRFQELFGTLRSPQNARLFSALLAERHYDVVHLNAYQALSLQYLKLAQEAGVPIRIAHSHNTELRDSSTRILKLAIHNWAKRAYGNVMTHRWACSAPAARFLFGETSEWAFIPNGINVERFRFDPAGREEVRTELKLEGKLVVGNVGRLCWQKNQAFLLDVFKEVQQQCHASALLLVGEGEARGELEAKARALGIENCVIFYGTTDRVERLYWAMDVFAFPSRFEGLGIAAVEAQAAGLPVICSDGVPSETMITEWARKLSRSAGAGSWAAAVQNMKNPGNRAASADAVSATGFDVAVVAKEIRNLWVR